MSTAPPFCLVLPGRPVLAIATVITPTQCAFVFPSSPAFSYIVVFLLPGTSLPNGTSAGIYIQFPGSADFKLLGAIGTEKQSAIYHLSGMAVDETNNNGGVSKDEMDLSSTLANGAGRSGDITVGISIEPTTNIAAQLDASKASNSTALVVTQGQRPPSTKVLAQRIIKNAFNFLASFAGSTTGPGGQEVVPLKSFQDWWSKFERRIENEPDFLDREN